jgi:NADH-quinone oxidoreductase subunit A
MENPEISQFGQVLLFAVGAVVFVAITLTVSRLVAPHKPNPEKGAPYECGEDPVGSSWGRFNNRFYVMGLAFLLFEAELVFLFPWSAVFAKPTVPSAHWAWFAGVEMVVFLFVLAVGLAYLWAKGYLDWAKPKPQVPAQVRPRNSGRAGYQKYLPKALER